MYHVYTSASSGRRSSGFVSYCCYLSERFEVEFGGCGRVLRGFVVDLIF
jgi:hypothetical protein